MSNAEDPWRNLAEVFEALAHPTRLKILALCATKERSLRELQQILGISKPLLLAHLKKLIRAGLIVYRVELDEKRFVMKKIYRVNRKQLVIDFEKLARELGLESRASDENGGSSEK